MKWLRWSFVALSALGSLLFLPITADQLPDAIDGWRKWTADVAFPSAPNILLGLFLLGLLLGLVGPRFRELLALRGHAGATVDEARSTGGRTGIDASGRSRTEVIRSKISKQDVAVRTTDDAEAKLEDTEIS